MMKLRYGALVPAALAAAITFSPLAHADPGDQARLSQPFSQAGGPFSGDWGAHKEHIAISSDGTGTETSNYGPIAPSAAPAVPTNPDP
jgi:hypothetical protein